MPFRRNNFEADPGNITFGTAFFTETGDRDVVVFFQEVQATIAGYETGDRLLVLFKHNSDAFTNS